MARGSKYAEVKEGLKNQIEIINKLNEFFEKKGKRYLYVDNGNMSLIDYTIFKYSPIIRFDDVDSIAGLLEVKSRNISSTAYGDIMCPKQKYDYAISQSYNCWMLTVFTDGAFMLDMKKDKYEKLLKVDRIDKDERGDIDDRWHCFWSLNQTIKLW